MNKPGLAAVGAAVVAAAIAAPLTFSSSHREAPNIMLDPTADNTDTYAFTANDAPNALTVVANWIPGENPANGPNFFRFDDRATYYINVDNTGDGKSDIRYAYKFRTKLRNPNSFLYALPPVNSVYDRNLNVFQTYTLKRERFRNGRFVSRRTLARGVPVAPSNVGPKTMPNYARLASQAIRNVRGGGKTFAGQRDDPFFIDLGASFDSVHVTMDNTENGRMRPPGTTGNAGGGRDDFANMSIESIVLQVPEADVTNNGRSVKSTSARNAVVGVWASTERSPLQVTNADFNKTTVPGGRSAAPKQSTRRSTRTHTRSGRRHSTRRSAPAFTARARVGRVGTGNTVQVSRLGNPLVNELVIPLGKKDMFNRTQPQNDAASYGKYVLNPELAAVLNALFKINAPEHNRTDLVQGLLQGLPGLNQQVKGKNPPAVDTLKINLGTPPSATPNRFGVIGGDTAGYPNGRRLGDDVVDIDLQLVAGFLKGNKVPLGDAVDQNDKPFLSAFPYVAAPTSGYDSDPSNRIEPPHAPTAPGGGQ